MGNIKLIDHWERKKKDTAMEGSGCDTIHYLTRKMQVSSACIQEYNAHIFICPFSIGKKLEAEWEKIMHYIAVEYQSGTECMIEKSNFYICFFVLGSVENRVKNIIEADSFSAKKYVFEKADISVAEYCSEVEKRIFKIELEKQENEASKLTLLELQNFRAYEGRVSIPFRDKTGKPASFVAIYAKNGVGKTSLFDGFEFALTGEVSRLTELSESGKGAVYHNRMHADEKAYVKLTLENGKNVIRNVASIVENGNDCRRNPPIEGKEIVGKPEQWNQTILPHHIIDGFISAKTPTCQYKEWIGSTGLLEDEGKKFIAAHEQVRVIVKEIGKLDETVTTLEKQLVNLENKKESAGRLLNFVQEYNKISKDRRLDFSENHADEKNYELLLNMVQLFLRDLQGNNLPKLTGNIEYAEEVLKMGVAAYQEQLMQIVVIEASIKDKKEKILKKKEYENLIRKQNEVQKQIKNFQLKLMPLYRIESAGKEKIFEMKRLYIERNEKISDICATIAYYTNKCTELSLKQQEAKNQIQKSEKYLEYDSSLKEIRNSGNTFDLLSSQINKLEMEDLNLAKKKEQFEAEKVQLLNILTEIEKFQIPEKIEDLNLDKMQNKDLVMDAKQVEELKHLIEDYEEHRDLLKRYQLQNSKIKDSNQELEELCNQGKSYLSEHLDVKQCPLCHTTFESWEVLFQKVNFIQKENSELLQENIRTISARLKLLSEHYAALWQQSICSKQEKVCNQRKAIEDLEGHIGEVHTKLLENQSDIRMLKFNFNEIGMTLTQKGIVLSQQSAEGVRQWEDHENQELDKQKRSLKELNNKNDEIKNLLMDLDKDLKELQLLQESFVNNNEVYGTVKFLLEQTETYQYEQEKGQLQEELSNYMLQKENLQKEVERHQEVAFVNVDSYMDDIQKEEIVYDKIKVLKAKCIIFPEISESGIVNSLSEWKEEAIFLKKRVELLKQISEETGARYYFEKYQIYREEIKSGKKRIQDKIEQKDKATLLFEKRKHVLEQALKEYFDQTMINEIYRKIDPHEIMKRIDYKLSFSDKDEPQLFIEVNEVDEENGDSYRPEWYFSTAQLNTVAFSSFFSRAIVAENLPISTIFIDDPIGHYDDMNILCFIDLIRSVLENHQSQIIISTHDEKIFRIFERKLNAEYYSSCFITLPVENTLVDTVGQEI